MFIAHAGKDTRLPEAHTAQAALGPRQHWGPGHQHVPSVCSCAAWGNRRDKPAHGREAENQFPQSHSAEAEHRASAGLLGKRCPSYAIRKPSILTTGESLQGIHQVPEAPALAVGRNEDALSHKYLCPFSTVFTCYLEKMKYIHS